MRTVITGLVSAGLLVAFVGASIADSPSRYKHRRHYGEYDPRYPSATPRQLRNLRAYERGEYWEHDPNAVPVGSRPWWEQKQRESGDLR
jgi:hypothetical protein